MDRTIETNGHWKADGRHSGNAPQLRFYALVQRVTAARNQSLLRSTRAAGLLMWLLLQPPGAPAAESPLRSAVRVQVMAPLSGETVAPLGSHWRVSVRSPHFPIELTVRIGRRTIHRTVNRSHAIVKGKLDRLTAPGPYQLSAAAMDKAGVNAVTDTVWFAVQGGLQVPSPPPPASSAVTRVRYYSRAGYAARMLGGRITGSNTSETNDFVELARITDLPVEGQWNELQVNSPKPYRYVKYEAPAGGYGNVGEIEFFHGPRKLGGTSFGTANGRAANFAGFQRAVDGNPDSFFDAVNPNGAYVGLDLGDISQTAPVEFTPRPGSYNAPVNVELSSASGGRIRYTLNGSSPSRKGSFLYTGPLRLTESASIAAIATAPKLAPSRLTIGSYGIGKDSVSKEFTTYHLGNSLTDTINPWLEPIARSASFDHHYYRTTIPGAPPKWLYDHPESGLGEADYRTAFRLLAPIDAVTLQPFSDPSLDTDLTVAMAFISRARQYSSSVRLWIYAQWPSRSDWQSDALADGAEWSLPAWTPPTIPRNWSEAVSNQLAYHERLRQAIDDADAGLNERIIPGGSALVELKKAVDGGHVPGIRNFFGEHFSDDIHLNAKGQYLVSLVFYACLFGKSPVGAVTFAGTGLTEQQALIYQSIAWDVVRKYRWSGIRE